MTVGLSNERSICAPLLGNCHPDDNRVGCLADGLGYPSAVFPFIINSLADKTDKTDTFLIRGKKYIKQGHIYTHTHSLGKVAFLSAASAIRLSARPPAPVPAPVPSPPHP